MNPEDQAAAEYNQQQQEQQQQEEQQRILGKFNSPEELAKAYQELEKKLGQPKGEADPGDVPSPQQGYSPQQAVEI